MRPRNHQQIYVIEAEDGTVLKSYSEYDGARSWIAAHGGFIHCIPLVICKKTMQLGAARRTRKLKGEPSATDDEIRNQIHGV